MSNGVGGRRKEIHDAEEEPSGSFGRNLRGSVSKWALLLWIWGFTDVYFRGKTTGTAAICFYSIYPTGLKP